MLRKIAPILAALVLLIPSSSQTNDAKGKPTPCDEFCRDLRSLLDARTNRFASLTGNAAPGQKGFVAGKLILPGATSCIVTLAEAVYLCPIRAIADDPRAENLFNHMWTKVEDALPDWKWELGIAGPGNSSADHPAKNVGFFPPGTPMNGALRYVGKPVVVLWIDSELPGVMIEVYPTQGS